MFAFNPFSRTVAPWTIPSARLWLTTASPSQRLNRVYLRKTFTTTSTMRDLVNRLIRDNQDLWNQLLHNNFVEAMRIASADDKPVLNGFKWYMIQDFFYCVQLIAYNADRAAKAPNPTEYAKLTETLNNTLTQWAPNALKTCTDADQLNIPDTAVFAARREEATEKYTKFISDTAEDENWVVSLLAQVPGIQVRMPKILCGLHLRQLLTQSSRTLGSPTILKRMLSTKTLHGTKSGLSITPSTASPRSNKSISSRTTMKAGRTPLMRS
ncbi:uncharacterized protein EDB91DRAFT_404421 [Suillus paluster]|uniref:uncharacterized protein n=1 Tax=Suillus paluster TaxID=48578 RepID=UPI001B8648C3|nr:uncharacterized protein EDB91DRAFT_404421 [Suillus paluster]KAG1753565.1 hypothetical protein EDB91DRAFT_404421 [Suillus paluster]